VELYRMAIQSISTDSQLAKLSLEKIAPNASYTDLPVKNRAGLMVRIGKTTKTFRTRITCPVENKRRVISLGAHNANFTIKDAANLMDEYRTKGVAVKESEQYRELIEAKRNKIEDAEANKKSETIIEALPEYYETFVSDLSRPDVVKDIFHRFILPFMLETGVPSSILDTEMIKRIEKAASNVQAINPKLSQTKIDDLTAQAIGDLNKYFKPLNQLTAPSIKKEILRIKKANGSEPARKTLAYVSKFLSMCVSSGYIEQNPAAVLSPKEFKFKKSERARALYREEVPLFFKALLRASIEERTKIGLKLLLMLGCRGGELMNAKWKHADLTKETLYLPAENTKNGSPLTIPLPPQAIPMFTRLKKITNKTDLVMGGISQHAMNRALSRLQQPNSFDETLLPLEQKLNVHDLRRSFSTFLGDLGTAPHVIEKMTNHRLQGVAAIYNKAELLEERKLAITKLANSLENPLELLAERSHHE
jgi:integrase